MTIPYQFFRKFHSIVSCSELHVTEKGVDDVLLRLGGLPHGHAKAAPVTPEVLRAVRLSLVVMSGLLMLLLVVNGLNLLGSSLVGDLMRLLLDVDGLSEGLVDIAEEAVNGDIDGLVDGIKDVADLTEDIVEHVTKVGEGFSKLGELELINHILGKVRGAGEEIIDSLLEGGSLDVLGLHGLVPLSIEAREVGSELAVVLEESGDLSDFLQVGLAGVVLLHHLEDVSERGDDAGGVVVDSLLEALAKEAGLLVVKAPVLEVVRDLLPLALVSVLGDEGHPVGGVSHVLHSGDTEGILEELVIERVDLGPGALHPVTEALIRDNVCVSLIETGHEGLAASLTEKSELIHRVENVLRVFTALTSAGAV